MHIVDYRAETNGKQFFVVLMTDRHEQIKLECGTLEDSWNIIEALRKGLK